MFFKQDRCIIHIFAVFSLSFCVISTRRNHPNWVQRGAQCTIAVYGYNFWWKVVLWLHKHLWKIAQDNTKDIFWTLWDSLHKQLQPCSRGFDRDKSVFFLVFTPKFLLMFAWEVRRRYKKREWTVEISFTFHKTVANLFKQKFKKYFSLLSAQALSFTLAKPAVSQASRWTNPSSSPQSPGTKNIFEGLPCTTVT